MPLDPSSSRPLAYRTIDDDLAGREYLLYSFGTNGVDDSGIERGDAGEDDLVLNPPRDELE